MSTIRQHESPGRAVAVVLLLLVAVLAWRNIGDPDFGLHLASGRWIVENGRVPQTDPFTYTVSDHRYVAYHWLFQVVLYAVHEQVGATGLAVLQWLLALASALLVADCLRMRGVSPLAAAASGLAAILASEWRLSMRPELASYLLLAATLWVLERRRWLGSGPLWLLPPIQLLWVNTHLFVLGWALMLGYLAEERLRLGTWRSPLLWWAGASLVADFVNPYHVEAVLYPLVLATRMQAGNLYAQHISELSSPFALGQDPRFPFSLPLQLGCYGMLLTAGGVSAALHARWRNWLDAAVILVFGGLSMLAVRNLALFALVAVPAIAGGLDVLAAWYLAPSGGARGQLPKEALAPLVTSGLAIVVALAGLTAVRVVNGAFYSADRRPVRFGPGLDPSTLGLPAADWLQQHVRAGPGFNNLNLGGTLMWRAPRHKVFIDGRNEVIGEEFFRRYLRACEPDHWSETAREFGFQYAIVAHRTAMGLCRRLASDSVWRPVFADGSGAIFVRADGPNGHLPEVELPAPPDEEMRWRGLQGLQIEAGWRERVRRWLWPEHRAPGDEYHFGTFLLTLGRWAPAETMLLSAALASPTFYETSQNLGALYHRQGPAEAALLCYRTVLMLEPGNGLARERAAAAERAHRRNFGLKP